MKTCFKCKTAKPLDQFYKHPQMPDGHVNKCKECNKADVRANRAAKVEYYRAYDASRQSRHTPGYMDSYKGRFPRKRKAQNAVNNAVKNGKMRSKPCEECGQVEGTHGHHDDYAFPLDVRWLCPVHHRAWHDKYGEAPNGN